MYSIPEALPDDCRLAHGLKIRSEFDLSELPSVAGVPDIEIRYGPVADAEDLPNSGDCVCYHTSDTEMRILWPSAARFSVRAGNEIVVDPLGPADVHIIKLFILGMGMAAILLQRGYFVLHASAVSIDGKGALFLGTSGAGKSTTAAAFRTAGYAVLSDDVVALAEDESHGFSLLPGVSNLRLWPDSVEGVVREPEMLVPLHPLSRRRGWAAPDITPNEPVPVHRIYSLEFSDADVVALTRMAGRNAFLELVKHSHAIRRLADAGEAPGHFQSCSKVAQRVPISRLSRPRSFDRVPDLVRLVAADCE